MRTRTKKEVESEIDSVEKEIAALKHKVTHEWRELAKSLWVAMMRSVSERGSYYFNEGELYLADLMSEVGGKFFEAGVLAGADHGRKMLYLLNILDDIERRASRKKKRKAKERNRINA